MLERCINLLKASGNYTHPLLSHLYLYILPVVWAIYVLCVILRTTHGYFLTAVIKWSLQWRQFVLCEVGNQFLYINQAVPWFMCLIHVRFVVNKVAVGQVFFSWVIPVSPLSIIIFILIQVLLSGQMDKSWEPLKYGCPTIFGKGAQLLLWAGLQATCLKIIVIYPT